MLKKTAYEGLVLSILLFGCELWGLPKSQLKRLRMFHNSCVRAMCRVTMWNVHKHKITLDVQDNYVEVQWNVHKHKITLEHRMQLETFQYYLARQRLRLQDM